MDTNRAGAALKPVETPPPLVSVIIPLHESQRTLGGCLDALKRQTFRDFEIILVDSSPHDKAARVREAVSPDANYLHTASRLLPQAARNLGAEHARADLLVFTDPDIYAGPDWLEQLVAAWHTRPTAVVLGSIACHGRRWLDRGAHLCKFNICLPGGHARSVPLGWSGNVLMERRLFESLGGWHAAHTQGDSVFTAAARAAGHELWFEPRAVVEHDHERLRFADFVRERYRQGREFAAIEAAGDFDTGHSTRATSRRHSLSVLLFSPFRIVKRVAFIERAAAGAGMAADYWLTLPVVLSGVGAWYAGLWVYHWHRLISGGRPPASG